LAGDPRGAIAEQFAIAGEDDLHSRVDASSIVREGGLGIGGYLDVHFISSLPVMPRSVYKVWVDRKHVQIVLAES
jgi:hypothetical protein